MSVEVVFDDRETDLASRPKGPNDLRNGVTDEAIRRLTQIGVRQIEERRSTMAVLEARIYRSSGVRFQ